MVKVGCWGPWTFGTQLTIFDVVVFGELLNERHELGVLVPRHRRHQVVLQLVLNVGEGEGEG